MIKNILVTGTSGEMGKFIPPILMEKGYNVTGFDCAPPKGLQGMWPDYDYLAVKGDLTSLSDCMRAITLAQADAIVHIGAIKGQTELRPGMKRAQVLDEDAAMKANVMGTYYLMDAARRLGVKKVIMASTNYTLGFGGRISDKPYKVEYLPIDEEHPLRPEDTYGLSKMLAEEVLKSFSRAYGIKTVAFRYTWLNFPDQTYQRNKPIPSNPNHVGGFINGTHDYLDIRDAAQAILLALENNNLDDFEAFYLATDTSYAEDTKDLVARIWPDLAEMAKCIKGTEGVISIQKAKDKLGYKPQYSWR